MDENLFMEIVHYVTSDGVDVYQNWLNDIADKTAKIRIIRRINRVEQGNFGDHAPCRDGVWEMRNHDGPGYRIYYAQIGEKVLLLNGGTKRTQERDIDKACQYLEDWKSR